MNRGIIKLKNPEKYEDEFAIPKEKLQNATEKILSKLKSKAELYKDYFPIDTASARNKYDLGENNNWIHGMHTGCYLLAYELSGDKVFLDVATNHMASYKKRIDENINMGDHDIGFVFSPSCVYYHRLTNDENARQMALSAAQILYDLCYDEKAGYIFRVCIGKDTADEKMKPFCRTMMDTMLNIPLFFWASEQTGDDKYKKAALAQCKTTNDYLIRADGSTYHHYQFELMTYKPLYGCTLQGNRDESTWTRGHAWGVVGFPWAYKYSGEEYMINVYRDLANYFLNSLPEDFVPYWDTDFISGSEPRDTSAGAIAACGMLSAADFMPLKDKEKSLYRTSANKIINGIIDKFTKGEYDGLVSGVTPMRKSNSFCTETNSLYGDYFFLEALLRLIKPDWQKTW